MGSFFGGTIVQTLGYRLLFGVALAMTLSALFVTWRHLPNTRWRGLDEAV